MRTKEEILQSIELVNKQISSLKSSLIEFNTELTEHSEFKIGDRIVVYNDKGIEIGRGVIASIGVGYGYRYEYQYNPINKNGEVSKRVIMIYSFEKIVKL